MHLSLPADKLEPIAGVVARSWNSAAHRRESRAKSESALIYTGTLASPQFSYPYRTAGKRIESIQRGHSADVPARQSRVNRRKGTAVLGSRTHEITVEGQAGPGMRAEFDECTITAGPGTTTPRTELSDQCPLSVLIQRVIDLRLEITRVLLLQPPPP